jgi:hypothetical protein
MNKRAQLGMSFGVDTERCKGTRRVDIERGVMVE